MSARTFETIEYETHGQTARITMSRPKVYNAINETCIRELGAALDLARSDSHVRTVIVAGGDRFFCAGADISEIKKFDGTDSAVAFSQRFQGIFQKVDQFSKPTIAVIEGFALGGGCELALSCDFRIMSESAELGLPEIDIGAFPAGTGTQKLPRLIGMARAKEILFTGRRVSAGEAYALGLANAVVPKGEAMAEGKAWAERIEAKSPTALAAMKKAMNVGADLDLAAALQYEAEMFGALSTHKNFREGIAAFFEKRAPRFEDE